MSSEAQRHIHYCNQRSESHHDPDSPPYYFKRFHLLEDPEPLREMNGNKATAEDVTSDTTSSRLFSGTELSFVRYTLPSGAADCQRLFCRFGTEQTEAQGSGCATCVENFSVISTTVIRPHSARVIQSVISTDFRIARFCCNPIRRRLLRRCFSRRVEVCCFPV